MIQRSRVEQSSWFMLFGDRIVVLAAFLSLAPAIYAIWLFRESRFWAGAAVGVIWIVLDSILLITLHNRRVVRLVVSICCTLAVVLAAALVVYGRL
jgi:cbb3-type cytochrome oxidase subunit 1